MTRQRAFYLFLWALFVGAALIALNGLFNDSHAFLVINRYLLAIDAYFAGLALFEVLKQPRGDEGRRDATGKGYDR